jgi:hypothetical protein
LEEDSVKNSGLWRAIGLLAISLGAVLVQAKSPTKEEEAIRATYMQFPAAFRAHYVDAMMKFYAPGDELVVADLFVSPRISTLDGSADAGGPVATLLGS